MFKTEFIKLLQVINTCYLDTCVTMLYSALNRDSWRRPEGSRPLGTRMSCFPETTSLRMLTLPFQPGQTSHFEYTDFFGFFSPFARAPCKSHFYFKKISFRARSEIRPVITPLGPDYMSRAGSVSRDPGTFVKHNKTQLRDYMRSRRNRAEIFPCNHANQASPASTFSPFNFASEQNDPPVNPCFYEATFKIARPLRAKIETVVPRSLPAAKGSPTTSRNELLHWFLKQ